MEEALSFFRAFEVWIYLVLGLGGLIYVRKFILAWRELRISAYGLERESAQARLNQSSSMLVFFLILAVMEFVLVTFISPSMPGANPLPTSTIDLLATHTTTLQVEATQTLTDDATLTPLPTTIPGESGCIPGQIMISTPQDAEIVSGVVEVTGTADTPNFGFYKLEMKRPDEDLWATIQAGNEVKNDSKLGDWDTRRLTPGVYQLGLVVVDNEAKSSLPCVVQVNVTISLEGTSAP